MSSPIRLWISSKEEKVEAKFKVGEHLEDIVTFFRGTVMAITFYATGCIHYGLQSPDLKDGKIADWEWLDESRLVGTGKSPVKFNAAPVKPSGSFPNPPQM